MLIAYRLFLRPKYLLCVFFFFRNDFQFRAIIITESIEIWVPGGLELLYNYEVAVDAC